MKYPLLGVPRSSDRLVHVVGTIVIVGLVPILVAMSNQRRAAVLYVLFVLGRVELLISDAPRFIWATKKSSWGVEGGPPRA